MPYVVAPDRKALRAYHLQVYFKEIFSEQPLKKSDTSAQLKYFLLETSLGQLSNVVARKCGAWVGNLPCFYASPILVSYS